MHSNGTVLSLFIEKLIGLVNRLLLPQKGGDCYAIAEQAIELLLFMFYIFLLSTNQNTGGLSIIHQSAPEDKVVL